MTQQEYSDYVVAIYMCYYNPHKNMIEQASFPFVYLLNNVPQYFESEFEFNRNALLAALEELCFQKLMVKHETGIGEAYSITVGLVDIMRKNGYK